MASLKPGILYLDVHKMYLYYPERGMIPLDLPASVVADLEIVDRPALNKFVAGLIDANKLLPLRLNVVLGEALLFRTRVPAAATTDDDAQNKFIASVPFEHVLWKKYGEAGADIDIIATNGSLIEALRSAFEARGWAITTVLPTVFLGELTMTGRVPDAALASETLKRVDSFRNVALTHFGEDEKKPDKEGEEDALVPGGKPKSKLPLLLGLFGVLFIILIVVAVFALRAQPQPKAKAKKAKSVAVAATPTIAPAIKELKDMQVVITESASSSASASLKANLEAAGVATATISINSGLRTAAATVIFSSSVSQAAKAQITSIVTAQYASATFRQDPQISPDVMITLPSQ